MEYPGATGIIPQYSVLGIYDHPPDPVLQLGVKYRPIKDTYAAEIGKVATDFAAKSFFWMAKLPL